MFKKLTLLIALTCTWLVLYGQENADVVSLTNQDIPDAVFTRTRSFTGESLYGYINGGADLYLEYGFKSVSVSEFTIRKSKFKVEIWRMNDPLSAFGIFSVSRFRCSSRPDFEKFTCLNRYQLQVCRGNYYINVINDSGLPADSVSSVKIGKIISGKIADTPADIHWFIPDASPGDLDHKAVLVRGRLGLMNGTPEWENFFRNDSGFTAVILPSEDRTLLSVMFRDPEDFKLFMAVHGWGTCDLSATDLKMKTGETLRMLSELHLLIGIPK